VRCDWRFPSRSRHETGWKHHLHGLPNIVLMVLNPWVALGIFFLLGFFAAYMTALSWADLTYVLPATSLGYVLLALIAKFFLHEQVTTTRWLGIGLISAGVGFVTQGPALTRHPSHHDSEADPETVGTAAKP
jgi:drug/metabolite transporter (DMT)-like permease